MASDSEADSQEGMGHRRYRRDSPMKSSSRKYRARRSSSGSEEAIRKRRKRTSPSLSRSRSRSPMGKRREDSGDRDAPKESHCLGVFGLSPWTEEKELKNIFSQYGPVDSIYIITDRNSGRSKGFGFVYFDTVEDAVEARKSSQGLEIDGRPIRVDFSLTTQPHDPTPGRYLGNRSNSSYERRNNRFRGGGGGYRPSYSRGYGRQYSSRSWEESDRRGGYDDDYRDYRDRRPRRSSPYSRRY